jgi:cytochrome P450
LALLCSPLQALWLGLAQWLAALQATSTILMQVLGRLLQGQGSAVQRLLPLVADFGFQRQVLAVLRVMRPNLMLRRRLVRAYDNNGTALVCRNSDVREVLDRHQDFEVVYGPRMEEITGGANFFLGMQDGPTYSRDVTNMRQAVRRSDPQELLVPLATGWAETIVRDGHGQIDLPRQLGAQIPARMVQEYFGLRGPRREDLIEWTTLLFWYLFVDLAASPELRPKALAAAVQLQEALDREIRERKISCLAHGGLKPADDVLHRCLEMQAIGTPGMDDLGIRNYLIGFVIGAIPTLSAAATQIVDELLNRPEQLALAQAAARGRKQGEFEGFVFEALRYQPLNPVLYRRAVRQTTIARGTWRAMTIPAGTMVLASNYSAMFDPMQVEHADRFWPGRPWHDYILWGYGMHTCAGAYLNSALLPVMLRPLFCRPHLRRCPGSKGQIDRAATPFPVHLELAFDPP